MSEHNRDFLRAVSRGDIESAIESIVSGADINAKTDMGNNAIQVSVMKGHQEMTEWLLLVEKADKKIDINNQNFAGETALYLLAETPSFKNYDLVDALIEAGSDINIPNKDGKTPLMAAIFTQNAQLVEAILDSCEKHNRRIDYSYAIEGTQTNTLLSVVNEIKNPMPIIKRMVSQGADINAVDVEGRNVLTALLFSSLYYARGRSWSNANDITVIDLIRMPDLDINRKTNNGVSALWLLCERADIMAIELMLYDRDAAVNTYYSRGVKSVEQTHKVNELSQLILSLNRTGQIGEYQPERIVNLLQEFINKGIDFNLADTSGNSPSSYFMKEFGVDGMHILTKLGGDINGVYYFDVGKGVEKKRVGHCLYSLEVSSGGTSFDDIYNQGVPVQRDDSFYIENNTLPPALLALNYSDTDGIMFFLNKEEVKLHGDFLNVAGVMVTPIKLLSDNLSNYNQDTADKDIRLILDALTTKGVNLSLSGDNKDVMINDVNHEGLMNAIMDRNKKYVDSGLIETLIDKGMAGSVAHAYSFAPDVVQEGVYNYLFSEKEESDRRLSRIIRSVDMDYSLNDENGNNLLIVACSHGKPLSGAALIKKGVDLNHVNDHGETALHHALSADLPYLARAIVEGGADTTIKDNKGNSVEDLVKSNDKYKKYRDVLVKRERTAPKMRI